jgi:phospholipid-binding lipoprotein MlaA
MILVFLSTPCFGGVVEHPLFYEEAERNILISEAPPTAFAHRAEPEGLRLPALAHQTQRPILLSQAKNGEEEEADDTDEFLDEDYLEEYDDEAEAQIADPLEGFNRAMYAFNDKLYFYALKPAAQGWQVIMPEPLRVGFRNFFINLRMPIRFINCLLQGKFKGAGTVLARFAVNTTMGVGGFGDAGKEVFGMERQQEDFGQTLQVWGMGPGLYLHWPILGPSNVPDSIGLAGDWAADPITWWRWNRKIWAGLAIRTGEIINKTSLTIGDYEALKEAAIDPYIAVRDGYYQFREQKVLK